MAQLARDELQELGWEVHVSSTVLTLLLLILTSLDHSKKPYVEKEVTQQRLRDQAKKLFANGIRKLHEGWESVFEL